MKRKPAAKRNNKSDRSGTKAGRRASKTKCETKVSSNASQDAKLLTEADKVLLQQFETTISSGLASFFEVGRALKSINSYRLYRGESKTFNDYCVSRWKMSRAYAYRLINAAACYDLLKSTLPSGAVLPLNESQLRPIVGHLKQNQWVKAWQQVLADVGSGAPTANEVVKVVNTVLGRIAAKRGPVFKKLRTSMLNGTVAKVGKLVRRTLANRRASISKLREVLAKVQDCLKSLSNGTVS